MSGVEIVVGGFASAAIRKFVDAAGGYLSGNYGLHKKTKEMLDNLMSTLPQVQALMEVAEKQRIQNQGLADWAKLIKDASYEAEDVLDDFATKSICEDLKGKNKVSKAVSSIAKGAKNSILLESDVKKLNAIVEKLQGLCQQSITFVGLLQFDLKNKQKGHASADSKERTQILPSDDPIIGRDNEIKSILSLILGYEIDLPEHGTTSRDNEGDAGPSNTLDMGKELGKTEQGMSSQKQEMRVGTLSSTEQGMSSQKQEMRVGTLSSSKQTSHYGRPHVIPIVGICGVGKTFLAHFIYKHQLLEGRFHHKKWFYMSQISDIDKIHKVFIPSFDRWDPDDFGSKLRSTIKGKRIFLVLDDVRSEVCSHLVDLLSCFNVGAYGSVILITTREKNVPKSLGINDPIILNPLEWNYFLPLLEYYAFQNVNTEGEKRNYIEQICSNVGRKLYGIPQAAKMIGNMLRLKYDDTRYWDNILNNHKFCQTNIFSFIEMAYQQLDGNLKQCVAFCSTFPTNYIVERDRVIQLWIANNFIQLNSQEEVKSEYIGEMWFNELVNLSFFLPTPWPNLYIVNSVMTELAVGVSSNEIYVFDDNPVSNSCLHGCSLQNDDPNTCTHIYSIVDNGPKNIPPSTRYLTVRTTKATINLGACSDNLRTLLFQSDYYESPIYEQKKGLFGHLSKFMKKDNHKQSTSGNFLRSTGKLRALEFSCPDDCIMNQIDAICQLPHLRFLDLSYSGIKELPETICTLYHLQVLDIRDSKLDELPLHEKIKKLPKKLNHLINLRHLYASKETISLISGIGKLTNLQGLEEFRVTKEKGHMISELARMNKLGGYLSIVGLENVRDGDEAGEARLIEKNLKVLSLRWVQQYSFFKSWDRENANKILNSLQPHPAVEELEIENYIGTELPPWPIPVLPNIQRIYLESCHHIKYLPALGMLPYLETLVLKGLTLKNIGDDLYGLGTSIFPKLKVLKFVDMKKWKDWSPAGERELLPHLEELEIRDCVELKETPLRSLVLSRLKKLELSNCKAVLREGSLSDKPLPLLSSLHISHYGPHITIILAYKNVPNLRLLSLVSIDAKFTGDTPGLLNLKSLALRSCSVNWDNEPDLSSLTELKMEGDLGISNNIRQPRLPSLRILEIMAYGPGRSLKTLHVFFQKLPHLTELTLCLEVVPDDYARFIFAILTSLKSLNFKGSIGYQFRFIPEMPPNLMELYIMDMPEHLVQRCIPEQGEDWSKIAHIPYIRINGKTLQML